MKAYVENKTIACDLIKCTSIQTSQYTTDQ